MEATEFADSGRAVHVPDLVDGYKLGKLVDFGANTLTVELNDERVVSVLYDDVLPAEEDADKDVDDSCSLMYLNEATLLNNCRVRYSKQQIYTYVANILISINPYQTVHGLYSDETIEKYQDKSLGSLPPHIFAIADKAHRDLKRTKQSQSIIVSGESGAGKTESQKYILRYLCDRWGASAGPIEQRLLDANPILEAFGNAKTMRNNNSSRFGKFVEIHFGKEFTVVGGFVSHYLLEKSRLCHQNAGERNYHVFYQLLAGADEEMAAQLKLGPPSSFRYLKNGNNQYFATEDSFCKIPESRKSQSTCLVDGLIDDYADFKVLQKALEDVGFDAEKRRDLFAIIAGILHLGNVEFEVSEETRHGGCVLASGSRESLTIAAELLGLDVDDLLRQLTSRVMSSRAGVKGTVIMVPLKTAEANAARDALVKAIYSKLFDDIVAAVNRCIPFADSVGYIGVLDIAGFEFFEVNSFEQFCINYCNEKLQQFFNERILKHEQELYRKEALNVPDIEFADNKDCIELFETKAAGLLDLLDEEARLPRPLSTHFTEEVHRQHANHFRLTEPRKSRLKEHRDMRDNEGFLIRHYAGAVCYQTAHFLEKNNDALHLSLEMVVEMSNNVYLHHLFEKNAQQQQQQSQQASRPASKLSASSVGSKFRSQLSLLLIKLHSTGTHFVRCIKPNSDMKPDKFEGAQILSQLKCAGMGSVLRLMHCGFPSRTSFVDLYTTYQDLLPERLKRLDPRLFCNCLFHALGLSESDFQFGLTKAFFKAGKFAEFDQLMHQDPKHMSQLVSKVQSWLNKTRWKKMQWAVVSSIRVNEIIVYRAYCYAKVQALVRGYLIRKKVNQQLIALRSLRSLEHRFTEIHNLLDNVTDDARKDQLENKVNSLIDATEHIMGQIKEMPLTFDPQMPAQVDDLQKELNIVVHTLRDQIKVEERVKLDAVEEETRRQKEIAEAVERERVEQEKRMEETRRLEALRQKEQEELEKLAAAEEARLQEENERFEAEERLKESERLDSELATRLANVNEGSLTEESTPQKKRKTDSLALAAGNELSRYSHAELRNILNTTRDEELLKACQAEFHRRLRFFNGWRFKNQTPATSAPAKPKPQLAPSLWHKARAAAQEERFFRTSLSGRKRSAPGVAPDKGFWYSHFEGEFITREIIFKSGSTPVLMVAGKDDVNMTHRLLSETGLLNNSCEVKRHEFEAAWLRFGGGPYKKSD